MYVNYISVFEKKVKKHEKVSKSSMRKVKKQGRTVSNRDVVGVSNNNTRERM